ncbi:MAG: LytR C-terminal domain-containing protein [Candidatus Roizmanbacteria bacterium]|nr:LytR C-terminal domain-containing protein [Candidatus Roizmanbacteria bacterium]
MSAHKKRSRVTLLFILVITVVVTGFAAATFFNRNPLSKQWDYTGRFTVFDTHSLTLISYPSDMSSVISITIPADVYINVPGGYGYYRVKDVLALSRSERRGDELLIESVSSLMGIPIEAAKNRMSYWDQVLVWQLVNNNDLERQNINLGDYPVTVSEKRVDGVEIEKLDSVKIDFYFGELFWERAIRDENITIGIFNASQTPGLANVYARILENIGYRIVDITNWEGDPIGDDCVIRITGLPSLVESISVSRLRSIFDCPVTINQETGRFDIQVILAREP